MFAAIAAAMGLTSADERVKAMGLIGPYRSRGHGGRYRPQRAIKAGRPYRSKYLPHQGLRERVRRQNGGFRGMSVDIMDAVYSVQRDRIARVASALPNFRKQILA